MIKLICLYARVSKDDNNIDSYSSSISNQIDCIKTFAKENKMKIDKQYIDDGYSGGNFDRPSFKKLENDIKNNIVNTLIVKDMSRLGRNFLENIYYINIFFNEYNVRFISINENFDTFSNSDFYNNFFLKIRSIYNESYIKDISLKRKQISDLKVLNGEYIAPYAPYGYVVKHVNNKRVLDIDLNTSTIVKIIYDKIIEGKAKNEICSYLNKNNIPTPVFYIKKSANNNWNNNMIYKIIRNRIYLGEIVIKKTYKKDFKDKKRYYIGYKEYKTIKDCHPAIISENKFNLANSKIKMYLKNKKNNYTSLFDSIVICGECKRKMNYYFICNSKLNKRYFYCKKKDKNILCGNRTIFENTIFNNVYSNLLDILEKKININFFSNILKNRFIKKYKISNNIENINQNIKIIEDKISNLYIKKCNLSITSDEFLKEKEILNKNKLILNNKKNKLLNFNNFDFLSLVVNNIYSKDFFVFSIKYIIKNIYIFKNKEILIKYNFFIK